MLYAVDNGNATIYELSLSGNVLRTIPTSGVGDLEGICHFRDDLFFIAEEGRSKILRAIIPQTGTATINLSGVPYLNLASDWANTGLEGVSFRQADNTLYAVKEINPSRLYRITLNDTGGFLKYYPNEPFNIENKAGDAADILALNDGDFIIVNQEQRRLEGYGAKGEPLSTLSLEMNKPEGITLDTSDGTLYLVGEPREFCVYRTTTFIAEKLRGLPEIDPYSLSVSSTGKPDRPFVILFSLPARPYVTIGCITLDGKETMIFEGVFDIGVHTLQPSVRKSARGLRIFRFSSGSYKRFIVCVES